MPQGVQSGGGNAPHIGRCRRPHPKDTLKHVRRFSKPVPRPRKLFQNIAFVGVLRATSRIQPAIPVRCVGANLRTTSDSLPEGTSEDVALFFDGIIIFLGCMAYFVAIDMPALFLSKGIFEANGVAPGGGVAVGYGIWLMLAVTSTVTTARYSIAIRKNAYRRGGK